MNFFAEKTLKPHLKLGLELFFLSKILINPEFHLILHYKNSLAPTHSKTKSEKPGIKKMTILIIQKRKKKFS